MASLLFFLMLVHGSEEYGDFLQLAPTVLICAEGYQASGIAHDWFCTITANMKIVKKADNILAFLWK